MPRLALAVLVMTSACSLYYGDGKSGPPSTTADASAQSRPEQDFANKVLPILMTQCGACHDNAAEPGAMAFLSGSSPSAILLNLETQDPPLIDMEQPANSLLVRKEAHEGPILNSEAQAVILDWLNELE